MFRVFKPPFEISSLEAWAKMSDDIAKVAILAIPVILYGNYTLGFKIFNIVMLIISGFTCLTVGRVLRQKVVNHSKEK